MVVVLHEVRETLQGLHKMTVVFRYDYSIIVFTAILRIHWLVETNALL
jgi:hypothetical protein